MADSAATSSPRALTPSDPLAKFPPDAREAHQRFLTSGDAASLDTVVLAVVQRFQSSPTALPDSARLTADLGLDSLALAEIVFFLEDLYQVSITNEELTSITTIGDLRTFIRRKIFATRTA